MKLLSIYHRLPPLLRNVAASLRGYQLRWWRYGKETERLVQEALEREHWSTEQWRKWQENRLEFILERAARQVPYYRDQWQARRRNGDRASWAYLENWHVLEKDTLRRYNKSFVAEDCRISSMFKDHTSGTTGKSLDIWLSRETVKRWYALFEARIRTWNGLSRHDRWGIFGGHLVAPFNQQNPPFWVWNEGLNQLYLSSFHLAERYIRDYIQAIQKYKITYLLGYSSALSIFAQYASLMNLSELNLKAVISNAEPLYDYQRQVIAHAFNCDVKETYGMVELVAAASECENGRLHLWPEAGIIELQNDAFEMTKEKSGDLIGTGLFNHDMPLIRYRLGDYVSLPDPAELCECGRSLPLIESIEGRIDDLLYTPDGRKIGRLNTLFIPNFHIKEAQIIQEKLDIIRVKYVPEPEFSKMDAEGLIESIRNRMGAVEIVLEAVSMIPRGPNGKFRAVICNLPDDQKPGTR